MVVTRSKNFFFFGKRETKGSKRVQSHLRFRQLEGVGRHLHLVNALLQLLHRRPPRPPVLVQVLLECRDRGTSGWTGFGRPATRSWGKTGNVWCPLLDAATDYWSLAKVSYEV